MAGYSLKQFQVVRCGSITIFVSKVYNFLNSFNCVDQIMSLGTSNFTNKSHECSHF